MTETTTYKVLWVDDDESIIDSFATLAEEEYDITLDVATNWEKAEEKLRVNFKEYSAIILDANCKLKESDSQPSELFLGQVSVRLSRIFGEKHEFIPWYVLSAGTMKAFDVVMALINTEERQRMASIWGDLLYFKDSAKGDACDKLFGKIREISADKTINKVLFRHADVFKYLGEVDYIGYTKARTNVLKMLSALYNPEENLNFEYEGNPIRHVVEYIFRTANRVGILPDDLFNDKNQMVILDSSRYLAGMLIGCYDEKNRKLVKYYSRLRPDCKPVFSDGVDDIVRDLINFSNAGSHTQNESPYKIEEDKKEIFFGKVLMLCHVIKSFGRYLESHKDTEENRRTQEKIYAPEKDKTYTVSFDDKNKVCFIGTNCKILKAAPGSKVVVESIDVNKQEHSEKYPLIAKTGNPQNKNRNVVLVKDIPSKDKLKGQTGMVTSDNKGRNAMFRGYCKLIFEYKKYIGKQVRIVEVVDNKGADASDIPYVATKVELVNR